MPSFLADKVSGLHAVYAVLAALFHRERTGEGQFVEIPMFESFTSFLFAEHLYGATFEPPEITMSAIRPRSPRTATAENERRPYRDSTLQPRDAGKFLELGGIPNFYENERFANAPPRETSVGVYYEMLREAAAARTTEEWLKLGEENRVPIMRANTLDEVLTDPHLKAVDFFALREHPTEGVARDETAREIRQRRPPPSGAIRRGPVPTTTKCGIMRKPPMTDMSEAHSRPGRMAQTRAHHLEKYDAMYAHSLRDPEGFWREQAQRIDWIKPFTKVKNVSWDPDNLFIKWFEDGTLNVSANCIDRHLPRARSRPPSSGKATTRTTVAQDHLRRAASRGLPLRQCAEGARRQEGRPGHDLSADDPGSGLCDARLRAHRRGAFGGLCAASRRTALPDASRIATARSSSRRMKACAAANRFRSRTNTDEALTKCPDVKTVIVVKRTGAHGANARPAAMSGITTRRRRCSDDCPPEEMNAEDPLFILYTSGSTGKPKGVLHTTGGYLLYAAFTHEYVFDYRDGDIYWCTADVGWVTGHSYIVYGPLANGATTLMFEGVPNYPTTSRFWEVIDKHKVKIFYTAPTAIRALMREGEAPVKKTSRASRCACSAASASRSIPKRGSGTTAWSATGAARSSTRGGRPKPAAS